MKDRIITVLVIVFFLLVFGIVGRIEHDAEVRDGISLHSGR